MIKKLQRRYQVVVDLAIGMRAISAGDRPKSKDTPGNGRHRLSFTAGDHIGRQQRLLAALLREEAVLESWLRRAAVDYVVDCGLDDFQIEILEEVLLQPVIASLAPADRAFFEAAIRRDEFCEWADPFLDATSVRVVSLTISDVPGMEISSARTLVERGYRAVIEADVRMSPICEVESEERLRWVQRHCGSQLVSCPQEFTRLQISLLEGLLRREVELDLWLKKEVISEIVDYGAEPFVREVSDGRLLAPVIASLDEADRAYFNQAIAEDALYDRARSFMKAIRSETRAVRIAEARVRPFARR